MCAAPNVGDVTRLALHDCRRYLLLANNALSGTFPTGVTALTNLQVMNVAKCSLTGAIPPELSTLTKLRYLCNNTRVSPLCVCWVYQWDRASALQR